MKRTDPQAAGLSVRIREASLPADGERLMAVIHEYIAWLNMDLSYRGFAQEMEKFNELFTLPSGIFLMAQADQEIAGCVGLLRHSASTAEVKRLYIRPAFRGLRLGEKLVAALMARARQLGYERLILDAVPQTTVAQALYRTIGFQEIEPYYANPVPGTKFFALQLHQHPGGPMPNPEFPTAINALDAAPRTKPSSYPEPFASRMTGRDKRALGDVFGLSNFGVNLTRLVPGAGSALRHAHTKQDEFVYVLEGYPVLITDQGETALAPGMCAGFKAGSGNGHQLVNRTSADVLYLEVGDRSAGDTATYPDDDLQAALGQDGKWQFAHKDGTPY